MRLPEAAVNLYPTKTRLALLEAVRAGEVRRYGDSQDYHHTTGRKLTAAIAELARAGWVEIGEWSAGNIPWRLTTAGRAVLDEAAMDAVWRVVQ